MNAFIQFFYTILYRPLVNVLVLLYLYLPGHDLGVAVIVLTLIVRLILHPFSLKGMRSQKALSTLQPKIKEIQNKFKNDKQQQSQALMEFYRKEKISPMSGCLPLLLQLPIIIALYQVFLKGLAPEALTGALYSFIPNPGVMAPTFLGIFSLEGKAFILGVALLAGAAQFWHARLSTSKTQTKSKPGQRDFSSMLQKQMLYFFPVLTVFIVWKFGATIGLYWLVSTLCSVGEQMLVNKRYAKEHPPSSKKKGAQP